MLNPLAFTESVIGNFLKYQLTAYPFQDERLNRQMRELLQLDHARKTPLLQGPFVSLSQSFTEGCAVSSLTVDGILHPLLNSIAPFPKLYSHQEKAIRSITGKHTTLISTGTGSGKSECFLYPAISQALRLRDEHAPAGISSVIVYPMNALAEDQLDRLRGLLAGTGITFGIYVGKTPDSEQEVAGFRMPAGSSKADYERKVQEFRKEKRPDTIHPCEEVCSRDMMRTDGKQPRILLTNVKQLELLLTRGVDAEMFNNATLDYLVFDEAHTFTGIIENAFKSPKDNQINTLVCTPTLELGVDIGALDCTLMRNVPPLPANYWQRVGRAGRRHRMAVDLTYCRSVSYDKAYYENPLKMLGGPVEPPAFNLKNGVMVAKHIHALILTTTNQLIHDESLSEAERNEIRSMRDEMFPSQISRYLFDSNSNLRTKPFDFTPFARILEKHFDRYLNHRRKEGLAESLPE